MLLCAFTVWFKVKNNSLLTWVYEITMGLTRSQLNLTCGCLFSQMMGVSESSRFHSSLKKYGSHTRRLVVNQVLPPSASDCRFCAAKRRVSKLLPFSQNRSRFPMSSSTWYGQDESMHLKFTAFEWIYSAAYRLALEWRIACTTAFESGCKCLCGNLTINFRNKHAPSVR